MIFLRTYQNEALHGDETQLGLYPWFQKNHEGNPLLVLPTGSGKSLLLAKICRDALEWPNQRILVLTHVQELIEQNFKTLIALWSDAPAGIYCAGLDKRQAHHPITFASIQSVHKKAELINWRDLVIIDETHLVGDDESGMYRAFLERLKIINPNLRIIGLSATPYRLKSGYLHKGKNALFSDIAYDLPITRLIKEGYLAPLVSKAAVTQGNTDKLGLSAGEFAIREAITEFDRTEMTKAVVEEMLTFGGDRKTWLIFCVSIEHAEHVRDALIECNIDAAMVCDKTSKGERAQHLSDLKAGRLRALTNVSVLTTGFDAPNIDMLVTLRPTMSPGLLVQMCGRGMRPVYAPGMPLDTAEERHAAMAAGPKQNCLILDMAGNLERHGPITHIIPPDGVRRKKQDRDGKMCQNCRSINELTAKECIDCGKPFEGLPRLVKHSMKASRAQAISDAPHVTDVPVWLDVKHVSYEIHQKTGSADSVKVLYNCAPNYILEWLGFGHPAGRFKDKAVSWWLARGGQHPVPPSAAAALSRMKEITGTKTQRVKVKKDGKFFNVLAYDLVPGETIIVHTGGNLGSRLTQVGKYKC